MHTDLLPEEKKRIPPCIPIHECRNGVCKDCRALHTLLSKQQHPGPPSPLFNIYEFTSLPNTWQPKHSLLRTVQWKMKWVLPSVEYLVTSVSGPFGNMGRKGKREEKRQQITMYSKLNFNAGCHNMPWKMMVHQHCTERGLRIVPVRSGTSFINRGTWNVWDSFPRGSKVCTTCINICQCFKILERM